MDGDQDSYDDEAIDRLVAGAYFFRTVTHAQWEEFVRVRAGFYALPEERRGGERRRFLQRLPFVRKLIEADRTRVERAVPPPLA